MKVLVLYDHIAQGARKDEVDALVQVRAVCAALETIGHESMTLGLTLDLDAARTALRRLQPDLVFNLVESLGGLSRLIHVPCHLLDALAIPYTGVPADGMMLTSNKLLGKRIMHTAGVPTPPWHSLDELCRESDLVAQTRYIIKSVWEHASIGLSADSIAAAGTHDELKHAIATRLDALGGEGFAEMYIAGREFNLALLSIGFGCDPLVLPPAEITFESFAGDQPRIVGYQAKWDEDSFEYQHTNRQFHFDLIDQPLLAKMQLIAIDCWKLFQLRGYARVDFRVDEQGTPWVLEVNANPCLSPDAGFAAALQRAGIAFADAVNRILHDVPHREGTDI